MEEKNPSGRARADMVKTATEKATLTPSASNSSTSGTVESNLQRKGAKKRKLFDGEAFLDTDTMENSSDKSDCSESSEPLVQEYPVNCKQFTVRSPTSSELAEDSPSKHVVQGDCGNKKEATGSASQPAKLWEPEEEIWESDTDEEEKFVQHLRSNFESDR